MTGVLAGVEERLRTAFGEPDARAAVTFVGADRIEVLRFPDAAAGLVRYATLGMSAAPMADPTAPVADPERGPRAELLLTLRAGRATTDAVLRPLAVVAASPQVEGVVVAPGGSLDLGEPLWPGARFTAVLVGRPDGSVPELALPAPRDPVRFLPLLPMTPNEAAWQRAHGADALTERWAGHGADPRDPARAQVPLGP
ncbi:suppressor of fused domain protein [Streptomyces sp. PT12]|uniref:suppressor of fused domain protein n=1 Tax=Streptomyces sp. PT12 TaxID=1510197 RepID=UPI000DE4CC84|nr:suppressor of fused domain protein [Streptomyces sp. PT12]RBM11872.1 Suppressor of fused domain protein [Streptomyces sp. PT12]